MTGPAFVALIVAALAASRFVGPAAAVSVDGERVTVRVRGLHRLWALRSKIVIRVGAVRSAMAVSEWPRRPGPRWLGWRVGTYAPGAVVAGTFRGRGYVDFWAARWGAKRLLVLDLDGHRFTRLVLDVADPDGSAALLQPA